MNIFPSVLGKEANFNPQIIPQLLHGYLFPVMLQGVFRDEGHLKEFTTSLLPAITVEAATGFHPHKNWGWAPLSGSHCGWLCSALSYRQRSCYLQASMTPNRRKAWYTMPGNTQNLMFQSSLWKLDNCPSVSLYVPFMAACSILLPHMCFFIGCCKLENIINSVGFRDSLKMIFV